VVRAVLDWFDRNEGWLLLLDNADQPELIQAYLPRGPRGHVLLTSRAFNFDRVHIAEPIQLGDLRPDEATDLLLRRAGIPEEQQPSARETARKIVEELACFPLAIEQAGAYIKARRVPLAEYLAGLPKRKLQVLEKGRPGGYPMSIATTWRQNFEAVQARAPAAIDVLRLSAFLHPDAIAVRIVQQALAQGSASQSPDSATGDDDPFAMRDLLGHLADFSLIQFAPGGEHFSLHRLVQEVVKDALDAAARRAWRHRPV
jgi:hypothetical protein